MHVIIMSETWKSRLKHGNYIINMQLNLILITVNKSRKKTIVQMNMPHNEVQVSQNG